MKRELKMIRLELIIPDPDQPRTHFDEEKLNELALSIKEHGQRQPIEVEEMGDGRYMLHHGERRWRAAQRVPGMETIEVIVAPRIYDEIERLVLGIVENVQRADLNPIEEGKAYQRLMEIGGLSKTAVARKVKKSLPLVTSRLRWLELPEEIQGMVASGRLSKTADVAEALISLGNEEVQLKLARRAAGSGISIKQFVATCARVKKEIETAELTGATKIQTPMLHLAINGNKPPEQSRLHWDVVREQARVMCDSCSLRDLTKGISEPAWWLVQAAAEATCAACDVRGDLQVCRECPGVDLIKRLVRAAKEA